MKHSAVLKLNKDLQSIKGLEIFDINYGIAKNIAALKPEIYALQKQEREIDLIIKDYLIEREKFYSTFPGTIRIELESGEVRYQFKDDFFDEGQKKLIELDQKYATQLAEHRKKKEEFIEWLDETESPFKPWLIDKSKFPVDMKIKTEQMNALYAIIKDE